MVKSTGFVNRQAKASAGSTPVLGFLNSRSLFIYKVVYDSSNL